MFEKGYWDDSTSSYDNLTLKAWYANITAALALKDGGIANRKSFLKLNR